MMTTFLRNIVHNQTWYDSRFSKFTLYYDSWRESKNNLILVQELNVIALVGPNTSRYVVPLFFGKKQNLYTFKNHRTRK